MANTLSQTQIDFRNAMAQLPAAVNIITTNGPEGRCGITASAVCSVTDSPPTVLVCVNRGSATHDVFRSNGHLCVNVLCGEQEELAKHFAGMTKVSMEERFAWDLWDDGYAGLPVLRQALVSLEGRISDCKEVGSHTVMFVELEKVAVRERQDSLVYFNRVFHRVEREAVLRAS
ncbi:MULTISPECIES: 4-hydroxyphenylacetate 3-monooxygenase, reductase component [Pseudomonas]|uniref:4-hydroxyphenylacetate 3-monooxygenase reductase component n=1 Tax=Pseudomonas nitroreducens TaxID=46680 RepID=A0A246F8L3_PSENT|nr:MULTISPECIES: 4-hydroxyphenylacetate 3-monooxygenase, reductase component [Pseudomonas]MCG8907071.1 4-hydroxyphenylacetate 3-monooxygenase, reductase component [Pseudomonas sp. DP-17]MDU4255474.1 4-hydroxyphenylacetate 3-monooxygenase, reductase component [Pseudomonas sp.]OWP49986.1 4-hydroxyphenylacetate 3-monooxygenase, reductase component [Pseudomonas nitroreducens]